ncbi:hypothetical protein [Patulibacter minatonensis]|uniref:hypothetical protein n=1 Tax=Patulibacter minatonensis TaxID=298163 RepID=UPI00047BFC2C|nr:hypothetical protein [Patulibacter minatonensis]
MTGEDLREDADDEAFVGRDEDLEARSDAVEDLDEDLERHGEAVARALLEGDPGDADGRTGWRGRLQAAADDSDDDPGILRIADAIHTASPRLGDRTALRALTASAAEDARTPAARAFLAGILDVLDPEPFLDGVH